MRLLSIALALFASLAVASPAFAIFGCKEYVAVTPDNAAVARTRIDAAGVASLGGTDYTKATFCPAAAAAGTCTGESLSGRVPVTKIDYTTFDGQVPDIYTHRQTILNIPFGPVLAGAC